MMIRRPRLSCRREAGNVAIPFVITLILLLGLGALVIDLGRGYVIKREMQNACDAGALAGATALFVDSSGTTYTDPQWANGITAAANAVKQCYVGGVQLSDFTATTTVTNPDGTTTTIYNVEEGYWNTTWTHGISQTSPANGHLLGYTSPSTYVPPAASPYQYPAVRVNLSKAAGGTGTSAPVTTYLASVLGINTMEVRSSAVAARYYPSTIHNAFPFAVPTSFFTRNASGNLIPNSTTFNVTNAPNSTNPGEWTPFNNSNASANEIKGLITGANTTLSIGNQIYLANGVQSTDYNTVADNCIGKTYMVAVVDMSTLNKSNQVNVAGFVAVKITDCSGSGSNPYVTCQWVPGYVDTRAGGAGPPYGAPLPTKLVQ